MVFRDASARPNSCDPVSTAATRRTSVNETLRELCGSVACQKRSVSFVSPWLIPSVAPWPLAIAARTVQSVRRVNGLPRSSRLRG